jgi:hypothetical protein
LDLAVVKRWKHRGGRGHREKEREKERFGTASEAQTLVRFSLVNERRKRCWEAGRFKVRPCFYPNALKEILLMSRSPSSKTAYQWKRKLSAAGLRLEGTAKQPTL